MSSKSGTNGRARPWSIATRLTIWYTFAAFGLVAAATGYLYFALAGNFDREDDHFLADKVWDVNRVLVRRPEDSAALRREVQSGGAERESGRVLVRVAPAGDQTQLVETPGMAAILPWKAFPRADGAGEWAGDRTGLDGRPYRVRTFRETPTGAIIQVAMDRSHDDELLEEFRGQLAYVLIATLLAAAVGGYRIARRGLRPIAAVTATARRIGPAHLGERIDPSDQPAEVRALADTFNHMLDRLADAFTRLDRFSADIAHEIRAPVNNLRSEAEVALTRARTPEEYRDVLGSCLEECGRLTHLIDSLLFLARAENPKTELTTTPVDVEAKLRTVREFFEPAAADAGVRLVVEAPSGLFVDADRPLLQRAVANLVANALSHTPSGGTITLFAKTVGDRIQFGVRDTGPGIPPEHLPFVFDRFYRADPARSAGTGLGLGLAIVKGIADLHEGTVFATSPPGQGAEVTLDLPVGRRYRSAPATIAVSTVTLESSCPPSPTPTIAPSSKTLI